MFLKRSIFITVIIIVLLSNTCISYSAPAYVSYIYDYYWQIVECPYAYLPENVLMGNELGIGPLKNPGDIFVDGENKIYLLDSGNNRLAIFDGNWKKLKIIDGFDNRGKRDGFKDPQGLFVSDNGDIYIADTENGRIVVLDSEGNLLRLIGKPQSEIIDEETFVFKPIKVTLDKAKRLYIISRGVYDGIIELDAEGRFRGFMGANRVTPSVIDYFWRNISTKEQKEAMVIFLPTEYSNFDVDDEGFLYATTGDLDNIMDAFSSVNREGFRPIKRLNPSGDDILRRNSEVFEPVGDLTLETSSFVDVCVEDSGVYNCLDKTKGRIFTYNSDGDLLYVFGGLGFQEGTFRAPSAIDTIGDRIIVLDKGGNSVTVFSPTEYGMLIKDAVRFHYSGKYSEATQRWQQIIAVNNNYHLAYIGYGKALLRQQEYKEAMEKFKLGNHRRYYSDAFKLYRKEVIENNFGVILSSIVTIVVLIQIIKRVRQKRNKQQISC